MKRFLQKNGLLTCLFLAISLLIPSLSTADTGRKMSNDKEATLEHSSTIPSSDALSLMRVVAEREKRPAPVRTRMPVWTEELGEVDLNRYTEEELDRMVNNFWTPERMRSAIPMEPIVLAEAIDRMPFTEEGLSPSNLLTPEMTLMEPAFPLNNTSKARPNGKVFFWDQIKNEAYVCSGSAINGDTKRLVATAGHCVHGGSDGTFYANWKFVPNFTVTNVDGTLYAVHPDGQFRGTTAWTLPDWIQYGDVPKGYNSDVAFVVTRANDDYVRVVDAVGGHGMKIGGGYHFNSVIYGYPGNFFNGWIMWRCNEATGILTWDAYDFISANTCDFGGGASGGPWLHLYNDDTGLGYLRSVSSWATRKRKWNGGFSYLNINGPYFSYGAGLIYYYANNDNGWNWN